jgi:sulfoquinovose isomerase
VIIDSGHRSWCLTEADRLAVLTDAARTEGGFGWLDDGCRLDGPRLSTWITCRMTHVAGLALLAGLPGTTPVRRGDPARAGGPVDYREQVAHGVAALEGGLHDKELGGWFVHVDRDGPLEDTKNAYDHAFVVLAASTAAIVGAPGAGPLLDRALETVTDHFWDEREGLLVDSFDRSWSTLDGYRGINANMHAVEAFLAAGTATGDLAWTERAARIADRVRGWAAERDWRVPEHFDSSWRPIWDYHHDQRDHPFRPYGATVGHGLEWSRLLVQVDVALGEDVRHDDARALYARALADGWAVDGADGFIYTTDWHGAPSVRTRMHWVCCEAIAAAATLAEVTGDHQYEADYRRWWDYARDHLVDPDRGGWHHELDTANRPAATVWPGKPDLYHAVQACLLPLVPPAPSAAGAVRSLDAGSP